MRVYMDACCLKRPYDDQTQPRIRAETEAAQIILDAVEEGRFTLVGSEILNYENSRKPNPDRREKVQALLDQAPGFVGLTDELVERAAHLEILGFGTLDALHLASAESANVSVLLTCDEAFLRIAERHFDSLDAQVRVQNPTTFLEEVV